MLAITRERIHLHRDYKLAARVEGRSSLARIGMIVHLTAPTIHAGFRGPITLEMINFSPFHLRLVPNKNPCLPTHHRAFGIATYPRNCDKLPRSDWSLRPLTHTRYIVPTNSSSKFPATLRR
jgi:hypothetical protein